MRPLDHDPAPEIEEIEKKLKAAIGKLIVVDRASPAVINSAFTMVMIEFFKSLSPEKAAKILDVIKAAVFRNAN